MVDFIRSFEMGISAAEFAEASKREINAVFDELNSQLAAVTGGKVAIRPMEFRDPWAAFTLGKNGAEDKGRYSAIAVIPKGGPPEEIAKWEISDSGYPCTISFAATVWKCANRGGLEEALGRLLQNPLIAKAIQGAISSVSSKSDEAKGSN